MFNAVNQFCQNYYDQLPADGLRAVGLSATGSLLASVTLVILTTPRDQIPFDLSRACAAVGISFLAAMIHALTTPIFNYFFDNPTNEFNGWQELLRILTDITLVHLLINHTTAFKVNLITAQFPRGPNFVILPHTLIKASMDNAAIMSRVLQFSHGRNVPSLAHFRAGMADYFDFNHNSSPIYVVF